MSTIQYRPEIDGMRAFAVVSVLLFHLGFDWLPGGFLGVDVFFVLSGFLITKTILADLDRDNFTMRKFWARRIRRILPALLAMITATLLAGYFILYAPDINNLGRQGLAALTSVANFFYWQMAGNYWGPQAESSALLHTWSLSVEEQFYFFYPVLVVLVARISRKWLAPVLSILIAASFMLFVLGCGRCAAATFYLLPFRAWELGGGCLLAVLYTGKNHHPRWMKHVSPLLPIVGMTAVISSFFLLSGHNGVSPWMIIPVLGTLLVIGFADPGQPFIRTVLMARPVVYIGKISYSLYLWHWPVLALSRSFSPAIPHTNAPPISLLTLIILLSIGSYHWVEQQTRRRNNMVRPILLALGAALALSAWIALPNRSENISTFSETQWKGLPYNATPRLEWTAAEVKMMEGITVDMPESLTSMAYAEGGVIESYNGADPEVVLLGDSHAIMWTAVLHDIIREMGSSISFYAADGTPTFFEIPVQEAQQNYNYFTAGEKTVFDRQRLYYLKKWKPRVVIISARWSLLSDDVQIHPLMNLLDELGCRVILIGQPPELFFGNRNAPQYISYLGLQPQADTKQYIPKLNTPGHTNGQALATALAEQYEHCTFVPIADLFLSGNKVWVLDGADVLYVDDDHLSYRGSLKGKARIRQEIEKALRE